MWDEAGPAEETAVTALQGSPLENAQAAPSPAAVEATPEPTAQTEPAPVAEVAAPSEPAVAPAETPDRGSPIAAPLDLAIVATGGTSSPATSTDEAVAGDGASTSDADAADADVIVTAALEPASPEPIIDAPPGAGRPPLRPQRRRSPNCRWIPVTSPRFTGEAISTLA